MKIVVIGGTGLIGSKLVQLLSGLGHEAVAASPSRGVNAVTGEGLAEALRGAQVVVDVANAPSWEDQAVLEFFETSSRNLLAAEAAAGVKHHVALSIVGTDRLPENGYFRAKLAQERLIAASGIPYTILRATQFFEFVGGIADSFMVDNAVRVPAVSFQPIVSDDVSAALADCAVEAPANGILEVAGPDRMRFDELVRLFLASKGDPREVVTDNGARYYGSVLEEKSLVPDGDSKPRIAPTRFADWLANSK
ncbi:SDR family oxidoreductase [Paenibacillus sacheonensis]|uniref:NAD(P)H-binding protein n=1 Tax=Paenibacillus sacheonensis TaxID=742054 RepID=A0A7X5C302_9BACL|nr:SDR family oxidoreductase [Paenibacillus sacheonensis]MBM7568163.1 uncharacterized protein YbjT (DUF2867 family) [Paenibacillus sacheonensis]NBC71835.1 NAD(P)H-binding protein [Paenibacillus sacheonensis]